MVSSLPAFNWQRYGWHLFKIAGSIVESKCGLVIKSCNNPYCKWNKSRGTQISSSMSSSASVDMNHILFDKASPVSLCGVRFSQRCVSLPVIAI